ncbi:MAG TPA: serine hydrolase domain-containing protein [Steroidobacteraceae bacterium]|nr:serine hydrolase domain-containing protein [Steroidobacteraceae bacterium]
MPRRFSVVCRLILGFAALAGCDGNAAAPLATQIDAVFREAHADGEFNGTVLVTRADEPIYQGSFGFADRERQQAITAETKFVAFSVNKPMTAVLVFQLIDAGKLALDDRLDHFFANLSGRPAGGITVRQLLSHTSGIEEIIAKHPDRRITPQDLEAAVVKDAGALNYSSSGFVCLALVLEAVTQRSYGQLLEESILRPAGMTDSGLLRSGVPVAGLAVGYREVDGKSVISPLGVPPEVMEGAGSLYTTTRDLWRFDQALSQEKILSRAMQDLMLTRQTGDRSFGWSLSEQDGKYFPWHKGSYRGYTALYVRQVHRHEMIAILSNDQDTDVLGQRKEILKLLKRSPRN